MHNVIYFNVSCNTTFKGGNFDSAYKFRLLITFANSLDPDQAQQKKGARSGSKLFDTLMVFLKKLILKKKKQQTTKKLEKFLSMQRVLTMVHVLQISSSDWFKATMQLAPLNKHNRKNHAKKISNKYICLKFNKIKYFLTIYSSITNDPTKKCFSLFDLILYVSVNSYGHVKTVSVKTTFFPGQAGPRA